MSEIIQPDPMEEVYERIVREIHLAVTSQDGMAIEGLSGIIEEKQRLEKQLGLTDGQQTDIFERATADSSYRQEGI